MRGFEAGSPLGWQSTDYFGWQHSEDIVLELFIATCEEALLWSNCSMRTRVCFFACNSVSPCPFASIATPTAMHSHAKSLMFRPCFEVGSDSPNAKSPTATPADNCRLNKPYCVNQYMLAYCMCMK